MKTDLEWNGENEDFLMYQSEYVTSKVTIEDCCTIFDNRMVTAICQISFTLKGTVLGVVRLLLENDAVRVNFAVVQQFFVIPYNMQGTISIPLKNAKLGLRNWGSRVYYCSVCAHCGLCGGLVGRE